MAAPPMAPPVAIGATLAAESEEPSLEPPSSPGSSVLRSQIQETIQKMAGLISQMDVVEEKVFRATDASSALRCCGRALNPNCREDMYDWSFPTQTINCFWSHSWHAEPWKNYLLLLVMYNGRMAVLAGSLAAFLAMLLFYLGLVPSYQRTFAIEGAAYDFGPYGLSAGCIVSAWVLLLLPPKGSRIFLDRICIHQSDHDLKMAGILSIGGFLKRSESMLVLWDTTYATRLWTVFELAAFLKSRESRETYRLSSDLVVRPSILGLAAIAGFISVAAMNLGNQIISADNLTQAIFTVTLLILVIMVVGAHWLRIYFRNIDECRSQLKNFSLTWARSHCCTVNHVNESGNIIICDREIIMECIRSWFGSQEAFEDSVQRQVSATLVKGLGHYAFPFSWFLGLTVPTVWAYGDLMVARLRANELYYGLVGLVNLLTTWGVATPFCFVLSQMLAYKLRQRRRNRFLDYTVTLLGVVLIGAMGVGIQIIRNLLVTWLDDDLLGISAWALVMIFAVVVAWRCWPNRYDDDVDEGAGHTSAKSR